MKRHLGLSLLALVLLLSFTALPAAAGESDDKGTGGSIAPEFKVFDLDFLVAEWTITCSDGRTANCVGSGGGCLEVCQDFCHETCTIILP